MAVAITIVVTLLVVVVISAFFLIRPRKRLNYGRMINSEYRPDDDIEPVSRPGDRPRPTRMKSINEDSSLTPLIIGVIRAIIGLVAVGVLAYIYSSTQSALNGVALDAQITRIYTEGIFKAVITIGVAAGFYIFTKFHR
jgi:hypothetical protein